MRPRGREWKAKSANNNFTGNIISTSTLPRILTDKCKDNGQQGRNRKPNSHIKLEHLKKINCKEKREKKGFDGEE